MSEFNRTEPLEKLLQLQRSFKNKLPERISAIKVSWQKLDKENAADFSDLHLRVHSLVGAAGTFGASMVSVVARTLEKQLKLLLNNEIELTSEVVEQIEYLLAEICHLSEKWQPSSVPLIPEVKKTKVKKNDDWQANIYLVEDDIDVANIIIKFLEENGYQVFYYRKLKEFEEDYLSNAQASAIIMDMSFDEGIVAGADVIKTLSKNDELFPPVIFISVHDDIQARLAAAQAGARRYFTKPIDKIKLLNSLDRLTQRIEEEPFRVLLIDDDEDILVYYSESLKKEGMDVHSFTNPFEGYRAIEQLKPELIVIDLYMPECSGFDLAKIIRHDDKYSSIPIIFLSSELNVDTQVRAMHLGGDDFLIKHVDSEYFIQTITSRLKRARTVNELNTTIKDALRESEYRLIALDQHAIISMTNTKGIITFANESFVNISGYSEKELLGKNHRLLKSGKHDLEFYENIWTTISSGKIWSGQICNRKKNGEEYWVESTIVPFINENGFPYKYVSVCTEITKVKQSEEDAKDSKKRLLVQQDTLNTLSTITDYILLEEEAFFSIVTQRAVETLNVDKVSIWIFDKNKKAIVCRKLFDKKDDAWSSDFVLKKEDYPEYFSALEDNIIISAPDAHTHPATSGFSDDHLTPHGIGAILNIPVRKQGLIIGVICCEYIGGNRDWCQDEKNFVLGLADLITLNIESSERKIVEIKLAEAKEIAEHANSAKSKFLSNMSHELRTPMNAISGFAQLIAMDSNNKQDKVTETNAKEIITASEHLIQLINKLLDLSKIESGKIDFLIEQFNCSSVAVECLVLMSSMIKNRNISLSYSINGKKVSLSDIKNQEVFIEADRMRFKQILLNLLSNAVKYNNENGSIIVSFDIADNVARISITDMGKGISKAEQQYLFQSFSRLGKENENIEGTGIGLVITKDLVELMGGKIGVVSDTNKGSTFWIEFPAI